jgi:hypothetical protein
MKPIQRLCVALAVLCALAACSSPPAEPTPSASAVVTPTATPEDPLTAAAQQVADRLIGQLAKGSVKAAAYVTTTSTGYIATLPDRAGFKSLPPGNDVVIVVEIEGWWPAQHSCIPGSRCFDTGMIVASDVSSGTTLDTATEVDPWSRDFPSPGPSLSERFHDLRHWGTPIPLEVSS